jgi:AcrR family transcriptional regulator
MAVNLYGRPLYQRAWATVANRVRKRRRMPRPSQKRTHRNVLIGEKTRLEILGVAEKLFAEHGPAAVSIRLIAQRARVNLAAVNYHFGSKDKLLTEVFKRRVVPLNDRRAILLDKCAAAAGPGAVPVLEDVIRAMVAPSVELYVEAGPSARAILIMQFLRRAQAQTGKRDPLEEYYAPIRGRFVGLLRRCLPQLAETELLWRVNFLTGVILYTMVGPVGTGGDKVQPPDRPVMRSPDEMIEQIVTYVAAGFRAPAPEPSPVQMRAS